MSALHPPQPLHPLPLLALLAARDLAAPLAWRGGVAISGGQFIAEAWALAERLPAHGRALNLCQDRYHFALGLAAALLRGQMSLLPPNAVSACAASCGDSGAVAHSVSASGGKGTPARSSVLRWNGVVTSARGTGSRASACAMSAG